MARPTEVKAITALLEAEHPDVEALAKAVIETLDDLRLKRSTYVVRLGWDGEHNILVGPFQDRQAAFYAGRRISPQQEGETKKENEARIRAAIGEVKGPGWWQPEADDERPAGTGVCSGCGHPTSCHNWPRYRRKISGCIVSLTPSGAVGSNLCSCVGDGKS